MDLLNNQKKWYPSLAILLFFIIVNISIFSYFELNFNLIPAILMPLVAGLILSTIGIALRDKTTHHNQVKIAYKHPFERQSSYHYSTLFLLQLDGVAHELKTTDQCHCWQYTEPKNRITYQGISNPRMVTFDDHFVQTFIEKMTAHFNSNQSANSSFNAILLHTFTLPNEVTAQDIIQGIHQIIKNSTNCYLFQFSPGIDPHINWNHQAQIEALLGELALTINNCPSLTSVSLVLPGITEKYIEIFKMHLAKANTQTRRIILYGLPIGTPKQCTVTMNPGLTPSPENTALSVTKQAYQGGDIFDTQPAITRP